MPKKNSEFPERGTLRLSTTMSEDIDKLGTERSSVIRDCLSEYIPVKLLMNNPMALPRTITSGTNVLEVSFTDDKKLCIEINKSEKFLLDLQNAPVLLANVFLFTI